jgi:hypothetical protein
MFYKYYVFIKKLFGNRVIKKFKKKIILKFNIFYIF